MFSIQFIFFIYVLNFFRSVFLWFSTENEIWHLGETCYFFYLTYSTNEQSLVIFFSGENAARRCFGFYRVVIKCLVKPDL